MELKPAEKATKLDKKNKEKNAKIFHQEESQSFKIGMSSPRYRKRKKLSTMLTHKTWITSKKYIQLIKKRKIKF